MTDLDKAIAAAVTNIQKVARERLGIPLTDGEVTTLARAAISGAWPYVEMVGTDAVEAAVDGWFSDPGWRTSPFADRWRKEMSSALAAALPALHAKIAELERTSIVWRKPEEFVPPKTRAEERHIFVWHANASSSRWASAGESLPEYVVKWTEIPPPLLGAEAPEPPAESEPVGYDTFYSESYVKQLEARITALEARPAWSAEKEALLRRLALLIGGTVLNEADELRKMHDVAFPEPTP